MDDLLHLSQLDLFLTDGWVYTNNDVGVDPQNASRDESMGGSV